MTPAAASASKGGGRAGLIERLHRRFVSLDATFPIPDASPAARVRRYIRAEILDTARTVAEADAVILETVADEADRALASIQKRLDAGEIDPSLDLRVDPNGAPVAAHARPLKVGVYPVAADPFHWGHLIVALRAVGDLSVDKVVFVLAGDDPRKPTMTPVLDRHPMGREVLEGFAPFFAYSPIAVGTQFDGETNIFRMLALNRKQRMKAFYLVGGDHYRLTDKNGNDDTLPKIEKRLKDPSAGHDPVRHSVEAAFIAREGMDTHVPTSLNVHFLPNMSFEASSTLVRGGKHALMPYAAYEYVLKHRPGLYGVGAKPE